MMKPTNVSDSELKRLLDAISEATAAGIGQAGFAIQRLKACIAAGELLSDYKARIPHGKWELWCEEVTTKMEMPDKVSVVTLRRWMRLHSAYKSGKINIAESKGIRQAYQLAGIVPDSDDSKGNNQTASESLYVVHINRLVACIENLDTSKLEDEEKAQLKRRLAPINQFYLALN